jgi:hypothetical protein
MVCSDAVRRFFWKEHLTALLRAWRSRDIIFEV